MNTLNIPQMEPWFDEAEAEAMYDYMKSGGWLMEFKKTQELEKKISHFVGSKYCVMTVNGTVSLVMALIASGLKPSDEVLVPNLTMIATPNSAVLLGIKPVLVDVEPQTLCMDLEKARTQLTPKTRSMLYVPLNGRCGDMRKVVDFCYDHKLFLIEDAAQAFGSYYRGKHLGAFGDIGSFSFSVPKIITTGQGGALITNSTRLYKKLKKVKDFGRIIGGVDEHDELGWNFKFTDLQAAIGLVQMTKLRWRINRKKEMYAKYYEKLKSITQIDFLPTDLNGTSPWFIDIYVDEPDKLQTFLKTQGIGSRRIYPAISTQKIYKRKRGRFPVSEHYARRGLWLPSSSKLTNSEIDIVTEFIKKYYAKL